MSLRPLVTLWIGDTLGPIERLSLASMVAAGHPTVLYSYGSPTGLPAGVELRDAAEVLPRETAEANRYANGSYALFSNLFRYAILKQGLGIWLDTDVVCLAPIAVEAGFVAGWETADFLNGAVLYAASDSPFIRSALSAFESGRVPPWLPFHRAPRAWLLQLLGRPVTPAELPHGTFGPKAVTALARRHGLLSRAQPREVFYPLPPREARRIFEAGTRLEDYVRPKTLAIHLWNEKLRDIKHQTPPPGSLLRQLYERFGI
jgi:hypothetical protein